MTEVVSNWYKTSGVLPLAWKTRDGLVGEFTAFVPLITTGLTSEAPRGNLRPLHDSLAHQQLQWQQWHLR